LVYILVPEFDDKEVSERSDRNKDAQARLVSKSTSRVHFVFKANVSLTFIRFARRILSRHLALRARCSFFDQYGLSAEEMDAFDDEVTVERSVLKRMLDYIDSADPKKNKNKSNDVVLADTGTAYTLSSPTFKFDTLFMASRASLANDDGGMR